MENEKFLKLMQCYIANIAISGSTLRNQGSKDVAKNAGVFLVHNGAGNLESFPSFRNSGLTCRRYLTRPSLARAG